MNIKKLLGIKDKATKADEASKRASLDDMMNNATNALKDAAVDTMSLAQDVTVTLQARIDDYAKQMQSTTSMLSDAFMLVKDDGTIESFNNAAEAIFGYPKSYIVGRHITEIFKYEDRNLAFELNDQFVLDVNTDRPVRSTQYEEFRGVTRDGRYLFIDVSASRQRRSDGKIYYLILVRDVTKRVENERQNTSLAEYNERLLTAVNCSQTGIVITDANPSDPSDYKVIFVNSGFSSLTGYNKDDLLGANLRHLLGGESLDENYWSLKRSMNQGKAGSAEVYLYNKQSEGFWCDAHITPVYKDGVVKNWIMILHDLTELKATYEILRKSEQHFRAFGETSSEAMLIHSDDRILDWNRNLSNLTEYPEGEISRMSPLDFFHPLERESVMEIIAQQESNEYETLFMTKTGNVKEVAIRSQLIDWENDTARIAVVKDITSYKDVEELLKCSRERYRTIVDNTIDLVCCFDSDYRITFANHTFRDYFNIEDNVKDVVGSSLLDFMPEKDAHAFRQYVETISFECPVKRGIHRVNHESGIRHMDWIDRAIFDDHGKLIEYQSVGRDITSIIEKK